MTTIKSGGYKNSRWHGDDYEKSTKTTTLTAIKLRILKKQCYQTSFIRLKKKK